MAVERRKPRDQRSVEDHVRHQQGDAEEVAV